jgi:hypothetical protein
MFELLTNKKVTHKGWLLSTIELRGGWFELIVWPDDDGSGDSVAKFHGDNRGRLINNVKRAIDNGTPWKDVPGNIHLSVLLPDLWKDED